MVRSFVVVGLLLLAGCASAPDTAPGSSGTDFSGVEGHASETTGLIRGVTVDNTIQPIKGVEIHVRSGAEDKQASSDDQGRFVFSDLKPGTYLVIGKHLLYETAQTSVEVVAGVADPPTTRLQMAAKFNQKPFSTQQKFEGYIECGYEVLGVSSLCLNDYETLLVPDIPPTMKNLLDNRGYVHSIDAGWSTLIYELTWKPTAQGTSQEMFVLASFWNRTSSDWYGQEGGANPVLLRFEVNVTHAGAAADSALAKDKIDPQGQRDLYTYGAISAPSGPPYIGAGLEQSFTIIQTTFYHAKPQDGWSFIKGDKRPF